MKRLGIALASILFTLVSLENIYAVDNMDNAINNISNNGRFVITFLNTDNFPIEGVEIEMFYSSDEGMIDIREVDEIRDNITINLVSDINGKIVLNKLPYGFYQYRIIDAPMGVNYSDELVNVFIDLVNENISLDKYLDIDSQVAPSVPEEEEPPEEEVTDDVEEEEKEEEEVFEDDMQNSTDNKVEEIIVEDEKTENTENILVEENHILEEETVPEKEYIKPTDVTINNVIKNEDKKENKEDINTIEVINRNNQKKKIELLKARNINFNDNIKVAILNTHKDVAHYSKIMLDLPDNDKLKKFKKIAYIAYKVNDAHISKPILNKRLINMR